VDAVHAATGLESGFGSRRRANDSSRSKSRARARGRARGKVPRRRRAARGM